MCRPALIAFLLMLLFVFLANVQARPLEPEKLASLAPSEDPTKGLPRWMTTDQREQFYILFLQAQSSPAAWRRHRKYEAQQVFFGRETNRLREILDWVFPSRRSDIILHDDGSRSGKIVFEGPGADGHMQIGYDPVSGYLRIRRRNLFSEWVYYSWERGKMRNACRFGGGFAASTHIKVRL